MKTILQAEKSGRSIEVSTSFEVDVGPIEKTYEFAAGAGIIAGRKFEDGKEESGPSGHHSGMDTSLYLSILLFLLFCVESFAEEPPRLFRRLSEAENANVQETCSVISANNRRMLFNATVLPPTESNFLARIHNPRHTFTAALVSPRHILFAGDPWYKRVNKSYCVGDDYVLSDENTALWTAEINRKETKLMPAPNLPLSRITILGGCQWKKPPMRMLTVFELKNSLNFSELIRPICLLNNESLLTNDTELYLYGAGGVFLNETKLNAEVGNRKTVFRQSSVCPPKTGKEFICGFSDADFCFSDYGSSFVMDVDGRKHLAGLLASHGFNASVFKCNGSTNASKLPLAFYPITNFSTRLCDVIGLCPRGNSSQTEAVTEQTPTTPTVNTSKTLAPAEPDNSRGEVYVYTDKPRPIRNCSRSSPPKPKEDLHVHIFV
ncbi:unnamed protein product [Caenorhabditis sp. 36 PRJEB53466]|nr:unnamed protein product [Caenorhabditis sp. 36 PRJEB53466]